MYHIASRATRQRRRRNDRNLTMTKSRAGELTVISRGIGRGGLILRAHFVRLVGSLRRSASPIGGARQHDRIARTVVNVGEVRERCGWVVQKSQGNPAGHEVVFRTVIRIGGDGRLAHDAIRGLRIAEIDEPAGQEAALAPPFISVLAFQTDA